MKVVLEEVEFTLVGRVYIEDRKTSAYIVPLEGNKYLFSANQLNQINNQMF